jgi:Rrf2 family protein
MNVGRRVDYAVRALAYLVGQPGGSIVSRADIEKSQDIPSFYLSKIMKDLVAGGLVHSHIGSKGGFTLATSPEGVSIKDIYETVERPLVLMECLEKGASVCSYCAVCSSSRFWKRAGDIGKLSSQRLIADIADRQGA